MIIVYRKLMYEPAVFIGFLVSCLALVFNTINNSNITSQDIVEILLPLATGAAVRNKTVSQKHHKEVVDAKN